MIFNMNIDTIKSVNQFTNNLSDYYLNLLKSWISINKYTKIPRGGRTRRAPPLKLEKNMILWRKIVIFHTKYPQNFAPPSAIGKNMIFWRKIVIFHTKYPKKFAPPSALHNFFKCTPLT